MKNTRLAAILNIIPGLGYIYAGRRIIFGAMLLISGIVSFIATIMNPLLQDYFYAEYNVWDWVGLPALLLMIAAFMYDARRDAIEFNSKKPLRSAKKR